MEQCLRVASATSPNLCFPMEGVERPRVHGDRKKNDPRNEVGLEIAEIHAKLTVNQLHPRRLPSLVFTQASLIN